MFQSRMFQNKAAGELADSSLQTSRQMRKGPLCYFLAKMTLLNDEMPTSLKSTACENQIKKPAGIAKLWQFSCRPLTQIFRTQTDRRKHDKPQTMLNSEVAEKHVFTRNTQCKKSRYKEKIKTLQFKPFSLQHNDTRISQEKKKSEKGEHRDRFQEAMKKVLS